MRYLFAAIILLWASGATAASFDCAKAAIDIEVAICSDAELSRLDEDMAQVYRQFDKDGRYYQTIRQNQRDWIAKDRTPDVETFSQRLKYLTAMQTLASCLGNTDDPESCSTLETTALNTCMSNGDYTTYAMDTCSAAMAGAWDTIMAVETERKRAQLSDDSVTLQAFDDAVVAFESYRQAECGWQYSEYRDGTIRGQIWFGCYLDMSARRVISLIWSTQGSL